MSERRGPKALELWCRRITNSYPGVNVQNMTTSWRDGLAFCAMIHHFRPDLIDFNSLNKDDVLRNNELAFRIAEQHLGIPALLDADDMASCTVPDRLSILTYLSQFYQHFGASSPSRLAMSRSPESTSQAISSVPESPNPMVAVRLGMRREACSVCGNLVFLAEKLVISRKTYHRTCFRCARCSNQLTPGNYYETEEGQYCCETCPDEDNIPKTPTVDQIDSQPNKIINKNTLPQADESGIIKDNLINKNLGPLSDEEKSLITSKDLKNEHDSSAKLSKMRLNFMENNLLTENLNSISMEDDDNDVVSPDKRQETQNNNHNPDKSLSECVDILEKSVIDNNINNYKQEQSVTARKLSLYLEDKVKEEEEEEVCQDTKETLGSNDNNNCNNNYSDNNNDKSTSQCLSIVQEKLKILKKLNLSGDDIDTSNFENDSLESGKTTSTPLRVKNSSKLPESFELSQDYQPSQVTDDKPLLNTENSKEEFREKNPLEDSELGISVLSAPEIDLSAEKSDEYPDEMNPFGSDEENEEDYRENVEDKTIKKSESMNPFGSDDEDEDDNVDEKNLSSVPPKPAARSATPGKIIEETKEPVKRKLKAPEINLNPFWSDDDDEEGEPNSEDDANKSQSVAMPVPKPRTLKLTETSGFHLKPGFDRPDFYESNTSLASTSSTTTTPGRTSRKKKPAPPPPILANKLASPISPRSKSSNLSLNSSSRTTPKARKLKPAPPPPLPSNTPSNTNSLENLSFNTLSIDLKSYESWEDEKIVKNEANKTVKILSSPLHDDNQDYLFMDKSIQGKWKRKKGPAPARPIPQKRKIKVMSLKDVKCELDEIELQQTGLEKQGVRLEQLIRDRCETGKHDDENLTMDVEELVLELFSLVNEKNELFRRQAELMLLKRQQRLEEEHADIEYQIRCLMCQSETTKTDFDKQREEKLIQRLVEIVERRSEIVECLEMDRRREVEEDKSINMHMGLYAAKNKGDVSKDIEEPNSSRKTKKIMKIKGLIKDKHGKKSHKNDSDKDVDETEVKLKRQNKKKWF